MNRTSPTPTTEALAGLHELFASATHDASAAMCRWTDGMITVTLDEVRQVALEEVGDELAVGDEPLTMVVMTLDGERRRQHHLDVRRTQRAATGGLAAGARSRARNPSGANWKNRR